MKEPIQCIICSEDAHYRNNLKLHLEQSHPNMEIVLTKDLLGALSYLDEKPPFKLLIRKPDKPLDLEDIANCHTVAKRDLNLRVMVFQKEYRKLLENLNNDTILFLQKNMGLFKNMKRTTALKTLENPSCRCKLKRS